MEAKRGTEGKKETSWVIHSLQPAALASLTVLGAGRRHAWLDRAARTQHTLTWGARAASWLSVMVFSALAAASAAWHAARRQRRKMSHSVHATGQSRRRRPRGGPS